MQSRFVWGAAAMTLALSGCAMLPGSADRGWVTVIDGERGLENFDQVGQANWRGIDGAVQATAGGATPAYLVSRTSHRDFMMRVEFWSSDDANSGVFVRCANPKEILDTNCYEANIFDQRPDPTYGTGAIVKVAKVDPMPKAGGKWNVYEITAKGSRLVLVLNGMQTVDVQDSKLASGPFALQWGKGTIKFRKVQIKSL